MSILTTPERLAQMMLDCHESVVAAYHYTQEAIDQIERPCFLIFIEDASLENVTVDQEVVSQGYSIAYVGQPFTGTGDFTFSQEYEELARIVAEASLTYLLEHPQMQLSNDRALFGSDPLVGLAGVQQLVVNSRSGVTLFSREGVEADAFWGFTIDITVKEQIIYETVGY